MTAGDSDQPRRYFFVHIMKTGGTTLRERLRDLFGNALYPTAGLDGSDMARLYLEIDSLREQLAARGREIRVIAGHFPLVTTELIDGELTTLTLLREPVERVLSVLRSARRESLEAVYDDAFQFQYLAHNHMTKMLSLTPAEIGDGMFSRAEVTREHLERARAGLAGIDALGLQERFDEFWAQLDNRFGWDLGEPKVLNPTQPMEVSQSLRDRIAEDNALDVELYEFAKELVGVDDARADRQAVGADS